VFFSLSFLTLTWRRWRRWGWRIWIWWWIACLSLLEKLLVLLFQKQFGCIF